MLSSRVCSSNVTGAAQASFSHTSVNPSTYPWSLSRDDFSLAAGPHAKFLPGLCRTPSSYARVALTAAEHGGAAVSRALADQVNHNTGTPVQSTKPARFTSQSGEIDRRQISSLLVLCSSLTAVPP